MKICPKELKKVIIILFLLGTQFIHQQGSQSLFFSRIFTSYHKIFIMSIKVRPQTALLFLISLNKLELELTINKIVIVLFYLYGTSGFFNLRLNGFRFIFANTFFNRLGQLIYHSFCFFKA